MAAMPIRIVGTEKITVNVYRCKCLRCDHAWESKGAEPPKRCAYCKSRYWNVAPGKLKLGRPPKKKPG